VETLAAEFSWQGRRYRQLKRVGMVALYEIFGADNNVFGFEVVWIRVHSAGERFGKWYEKREGYPASESWGTYGWSYLGTDRAGAEERFDEVTYRATSHGKQADTEFGAS
jgi:hypothetical protein